MKKKAKFAVSKKLTNPGLSLNKKHFLINSISISLFTFLVLHLTVLHNKTYLFKLQNLSLFLPTKMFFLDNISPPGGFLSYIGLFLTQFFYYPWLGGLILIFLLFVIHFLTMKVFKLPRKLYTLSFIPSLLLLLTITQLGYYIYLLYSNGYIFSNLIGVIICLGAFWIYRNINRSNLRLLFSFFFIIFFFHIAGFYSLFTVLLFVVFEIVTIKKNCRIDHFIVIILSLIFMFGIPLLYYRFFYIETSFPGIYIAAFPAFGITGDFFLYLPFVALFAFLICTVFNFLPITKPQKPHWLFCYIPAFIFLLTIIGVYHFSHDDENFRTELAMEQAIFKNDWNEVLTLSRKLKGEPTRLIVMDTYLALRKLHVAGDIMFAFKNGEKHFNTRKSISTMEIAGKMFYFHYGKLNYCFRWCMEDRMNYGKKIENLKYFVKSCLLNGEILLAKKYNDVLKKTLFHKSWAREYHKFIENPEKVHSDPEFSEIIPLLAYKNDLYGGINNRLEDFLRYGFASINSGTPEMLELSLQCILEYKNIKSFWPRFAYYAENHSKIPIHYQEAALLFAYLENRADISNLKVDSDVLDKFREFVKVTKQYSTLSRAEQESILSKDFGDTYWYYYFYSKRFEIK